MAKTKRHKCFTEVDAKLAEHNTRLVTNMFDSNQLLIETMQVERGRGKPKAKCVIASFCPFCGKAI